MIDKVFNFIEKSATAKSQKFITKHNMQKFENVEEKLVNDYNPRTARIRSLKDVFVFNAN